MLSRTDEPECRRRQCLIPARHRDIKNGVDAITAEPAVIETSADDAPDRQATKALAHATIHSAINGPATTGRELAHSIAVN
jgi:hypothetical protein